ncbi:MAG TPA: flagellar export protein FliJ [Phycisphaerales bacterium]|nr:flagellar export protein FliJ [Phycisphaerales bacterium]
MAKFVFNLEAVRKQRTALEKQRMVAVAELERERLTLEDRIRAAHESVEAERLELREQLSGMREGEGRLVDLRGVRFQAGAAVVLRARTQQLVLQLAGLHKRLEKAREELRQAVAARKAVDLLRDRRFEEWRRELARREAMTLDELATMRGVRDEATEVQA